MEPGSDYGVAFINIGKFFRELRLSRKDKLATVANSIGVTHPVISMIENGRYDGLSFKLLQKLSEYYGVSFEEVIHSSLREIDADANLERQKIKIIQDLVTEAFKKLM